MRRIPSPIKFPHSTPSTLNAHTKNKNHIKYCPSLRSGQQQVIKLHTGTDKGKKIINWVWFHRVLHKYNIVTVFYFRYIKPTLTAADFNSVTHILVTGFSNGVFFIHEMPEAQLVTFFACDVLLYKSE